MKGSSRLSLTVTRLVPLPMWAFFVAAGVGILILAISLALVLHFKCRDEDTIPASDKPNTGKGNITLKEMNLKETEPEVEAEPDTAQIRAQSAKTYRATHGVGQRSTYHYRS